jgi:hypothetical protein
MSFCDHCEGQRFDRAQVLRLLRQTQKDLQRKSPRCKGDEALRIVIEAVRALELPHLEREDEIAEDQVIH